MIPLYRRVLAERFATLPPSVRDLHSVDRPRVWRGTATVRQGTNIFARLAATVLGLPPQGDHVALCVTFTPHANGDETWDRDFAGRRFLSVQSDAGDGVIAERVGLITLRLRPGVEGGSLTLEIAGARLLGLPLPTFVLPRVATREFEQQGLYHFDVLSHLPLIGLLVHYSGTLRPDDRPALT